MREALGDDTDYIPDLMEMLGCKVAPKVGDAVRCKKRFYPVHWSYANQGFPEGKLCWIKDVYKAENGKTYYAIEAERFEILQPSEDTLEEKVFWQYFKKTKAIEVDWRKYGVSYK